MSNLIILVAAYPIDAFFLAESTLRLWRCGFPLLEAYRYSVNR